MSPSTERVRKCRERQRESRQHRDLFRAAAILVRRDNEARGGRMVLLQRVDRLLADHPRFSGLLSLSITLIKFPPSVGL